MTIKKKKSPSEKPKDNAKEAKAPSKSPRKEETKKEEPKKKEEDTKKKEKSDSIEQLWKRGSGGLKKTEQRFMCIDGTKLKYAKKENDLNGTKGVKSIELKAAKILSEKELQGRFWIRIKGSHENREIACKTKESRDKWLDILQAASGEAKAEKTKEDNKKIEKPKEEPKKNG